MPYAITVLPATRQWWESRLYPHRKQVLYNIHEWTFVKGSDVIEIFPMACKKLSEVTIAHNLRMAKSYYVQKFWLHFEVRDVFRCQINVILFAAPRHLVRVSRGLVAWWLQAGLHDLITKNMDKIKKPRSTNTDNMYWCTYLLPAGRADLQSGLWCGWTCRLHS